MPSDQDDNTRLLSLMHGASFFITGKISKNILRALLNAVFTRVLGASLFGIYTYSWTLTSFAMRLGRFGTGKSLLHFLPIYENDKEKSNNYVSLAYITALFGGSLLGFIGYISAPFISKATLNTPMLTQSLRIFALALPFYTLIQLCGAIFRSLENIRDQILVVNILMPGVRFLFGVIAILVGYSLLGIVAALSLAGVFVSIVGIRMVYRRTNLRPTLNIHNGGFFEFYNYSIPLTFKDIGSLLYTRVDVLMVGLFLTGSSVGIYRICTMVSMFISLPFSAFNQLFPPIASRLHSSGKKEELTDLYKTVTRWVVTITIPFILVIILYGSEILRIFGSEFTTGAVVLSVLAFGQFTNYIVGPSGFLLMMTNHQYLNMINQWTVGILNAILNYILIQEYGILGAAIATAFVLMFINVIRAIQVWYTENMTPISLGLIKPLVAGGGCAAALFAVSVFLSGFQMFMLGSVAGGLVYLLILYLLGIESSDREFFDYIIHEYTDD